MAKLRQFGLLMWKNFLLHRRKPLVTFFEIALPTIASMILLLIRQRVESTTITEPTEWKPFGISSIPSSLATPSFDPWTVVFSPNTNVTRRLMERVSKDLKVVTAGHGYATEQEVVNLMMTNNKTTQDILAGVIFYNTTEKGFEDEKNITYKLRFPSLPRMLNMNSKKFSFLGDKNWRTQFMFPSFQTIGPRESGSIHGKDPGYYEEGFLALQLAVDNAIIMDFNASYDKKSVDITMRRAPFPPYNNDLFVVVIQQQLSFIIMVSYVFLALNIVKNVVHEKERKLKESMKMMGLSNWLHWLAWFMLYFLMMAVTVSIITFFLCIKIGPKGSVIDNSDPSVIFVFLMLYAASTIAFCFAVSVFFTKAIAGAAAGGILFFLSYLPFNIIQPRYATLSLTDKVLPCLINNVAMSLGGQVIGMFEGTGEGIQWSNLHRGSSVDDDFTMLLVMLMMVVDTVIYCLIAWYVEAVHPGDYGIPLPWYFLFTKSYWCGMSVLTEEEAEETVPLLTNAINQKHGDYEREPGGIRAGIRIRNLRKEYGSGKNVNVAVKGMNLNIYEGQVTALLGHNGAGKTTTMFMLTGFIPPTSGTAFVNGYDICKDINQVRSSLGLCPQHDVLFDSLTVEEHLIFFCKLKGFPSRGVGKEVDRMLASLGLEDKRHSQSKTLSGGMKRKLSVGIALIGDSKVVILDEPTSGMDPNARRHTWDILQKHRAGRTMILSTHFMDEADLLGDRIAIMAEGVVKCCGSSLFLKKKYGAGYHMIMVKEDSCNVNQITSMVKKHVPAAELESNIGKELSYILPHESSDRFEDLFNELEGKRHELGIASYGASVTTMEEVFMKVGESSDSTLKEKLTGGAGEPATFDYNSTEVSDNYENANTAMEFDKSVDYNSGLALYAQQFRAMFVKRVLHTWRNKLLTISQLAVPLVFTIIAMTVVKTLPIDGDLPPLALNLSKLEDNVVAYSTDRFVNNQTSKLAEFYNSQFTDDDETATEWINKLPQFKNNPDLEKFLISQGQESVSRYNSHYIVAASFENKSNPNVTKAEAYFNNQAYHSPGMTLNVLNNAILKYFTNKEAIITTINHPLPRGVKERVDDETQTLAIGFSVSFCVLFGMAFLASSFVMFLIKERATKAKHCQFVSGVHSSTFWFSTFCWDFINFMVPVVLLLVVFAAFGIEGYVEPDRLPLILLIFILYGWAMLPFMYILSYIFTVPSTGLVWLSIFNIFSGVITVLAVQILNIPQLGTADIAKAIEWICLVLIPNFGLGQAMNSFYNNYQFMKICTNPEVQDICKLIPDFLNITVACCKGKCGDDCLAYVTDYMSFEEGGIGRMVLFMAIQGFVFGGILFIVETSLFHRLWSGVQMQQRPVLGDQSSLNSQIEEDSDVVKERLRVTNTHLDALLGSDSLIMQDLYKYYGEFLAVDGISVGIPQGECFGLLGINGAGKTTTFKMLTGDETVSSGDAFLNGYSISGDIKKVQQSLGYCPQFDALIDQMTGREMLNMYARLRGVKECLISFVVDRLIESLMLTAHADKLVGEYSGGNKRKLSTAIALVGEPPIVFLDEPTTGMDPVARRFIWDALSHYRASGRTLVLTSHSMEECEALCTRVAIMVNGQFRCLGSTQHLKNKFGEGYTLMAKVAFPEHGEPDITPLLNFVEESFPGSHLKDVHQGLVHYHITDTTLSWAKIFGTLERAKVTLNLEDYSVSQTTLEQVFINFARTQIPPREDEKNGCCTRCWSTLCLGCCAGRGSCCSDQNDNGGLD